MSTFAGRAGQSGSADGTGSAANFNGPTGVAVDGSSNVYIADYWNSTVRKITPAGAVTTLAGTVGQFGSTDGTGPAASFNAPFGVAVDGAGNVYVGDYLNSTVRKITPAGVVSTLAGTAGQLGSADGSGSAARFRYPYGVAVDGSGNVFLADCGNSTIRKISPAGAVTTLAGMPRQAGSDDGTGSAARFGNPIGAVVDGSGNLYVADYGNDTIRKITSTGAVTTLAGTAGQVGSADGTGAAASFNGPTTVAVDSSGNVYAADMRNHIIRKITPAGVVTTLAGTAGQSGSADGTGSAAKFSYPNGVAVDGSGIVYVTDTGNRIIRKVTPAGVVTTLAGTAGLSGSADGTGSAATFKQIHGVVVDGAGNIYVAEIDNHTIRKITPAGVVTTLAGAAGQSGSADGIGSGARFSYPNNVAVDVSGNIYVADGGNNTIRKISSAGVVTTLVGSAQRSGTVVGPLPASLYAPGGVTVDPTTGNLFIVVPDAILKVVL